MRNYEIKPNVPPRFESDFKIEVKPNQTENPGDQPALIKIGGAVEILAAGEAKDAAATYPETLLAARKAERKTAATNLRAIAQRFIDEKLSVSQTEGAIDAEVKRHAGALPDFSVKDKAVARFPGEFEIVCAAEYEPSDPERRYLNTLSLLLDEMANDGKVGLSDGYGKSVLEARKVQRDKDVAALKEKAEQFCAKKTSAADCADHVLIRTGRYRVIRDRLARTLFTVAGVTAEDASKDIAKRYVDVSITFFDGLPAPQDTPSAEQEDLFTQLNKTTTIIRLVCQRMKEPPKTWWGKPAVQEDPLAVERSERLLHEYMDKICGIAVVGLQQPYTKIAKAALNELRGEFAALMAGRIKNQYVRKLGAAAGVFAAFFLGAYIVLGTFFPGWVWGVAHKPFLLAAAGAAIGTWLSFSIRQVQLLFDDLLLLEDSSVDPPLRVLFVIALTWTACLLFWTGTFNIEIGSLKTTASALQLSGSIALLIGLFCGMSERALATAISGRAAAFVQGVASGR